jgi:hypothetical protein
MALNEKSLARKVIMYSFSANNAKELTDKIALFFPVMS